MKRLNLLALTAGVITALPASLLAQTPATDTAAAASPAAPAPAASPAPADSASPSDTPKKTAAKRKTSDKKITRQQQIDHSIESGTVPSRYRSQVPKEYQQYIPFDKR